MIIHTTFCSWHGYNEDHCSTVNIKYKRFNVISELNIIIIIIIIIGVCTETYVIYQGLF